MTARWKRTLLAASLLLAAGAMPAAGPVAAAEPRTLPAITFLDRDGHTVTLDAFKGKVVILDFWATWCPPCREEFPQLDAMQGHLSEKGVVVVAVSVDRGGLKAVDRFFAETHVKNLDKYYDVSGASAHSLGIDGLPTTLVLDRQGREAARYVGYISWSSPETVALLQRLLAGG
ncbi:MAG: TlpA family protein disulfide reductase [Telmatospirillum sp.]|nr:TlpA family protein disulfide reductase [Telmatospirillum sp.]